MKNLKPFILLLSLFFSCQSFAAIKTRPLITDSRIKTVTFNKNNVYPINAATFITTQVVFAHDEFIKTIQNGDLPAWIISVEKDMPNMFFIKPTIENSNTNLTVITNKHVYYFALTSCDKDDLKNKDLNYAIHFIYPEDATKKINRDLKEKLHQQKSINNAFTNPDNYNWNYSFNGTKTIMPLHVFDDGTFTYLQLRPHQEIPAIFSVDNENGNEAVVNFRKQGNYIIIETIAPEFTLRSGEENVANIFNENLIKR